MRPQPGGHMQGPKPPQVQPQHNMKQMIQSLTGFRSRLHMFSSFLRSPDPRTVAGKPKLGTQATTQPPDLFRHDPRDRGVDGQGKGSKDVAGNILSFGSRVRQPKPSPTGGPQYAEESLSDFMELKGNRTSPADSSTASFDGDTYWPIDSAHHPVMQLIRQRHMERSQPGRRLDPFKLGLAVEGGGMRGVISGAMLMWLERRGMREVFDVVYGSSAGAINATYFLSGQQDGLHVYVNDLAEGSKFLNLSALLNGEPAMNLEYLIEEVMKQRCKLDWKAVMESPVPLKCVASSLDSLDSELLDGYTTEEELVNALKASATVPGFAGPPRVVRGQRLVDAAVFEAVPIRSAIRDGCTHVLVLCTRPPPQKVGPLRKRLKQTVEHMVKRTVLNPPYMREAWRRDVSFYEEQCEEMLSPRSHEDPDGIASKCGAYVLPVQPMTTRGCHPLCTDAATLTAGIEEGESAMARIFGVGGTPVTAVPGDRAWWAGQDLPNDGSQPASSCT